ncbi:MAG: sulfate ABC transporter substrate-binding protein, partial [Thaumarchaeota archaeon S15]
LFSRGLLDAAWVPEPWATLLVETLGAERVLDESGLWEGGQFASVVLVARAGYVAEMPGGAASWLRAHNATAAWIAANPEGAREAYAEFASREALAALPADVLDESFSRVEITTRAPEGPILEFAERASALGYLGGPPPRIGGIFYGGAGGAGG